MLNCSPAATPIDTNAKLSAIAGSLATDASHYRSIVGGLQYLTLTRPELQYAVQQVYLYIHAPCDAHWTAVKRILRYIRGSIDLGLTISASPSLDIVAYLDADWAG
jgi:histone deacetylase 1/2